MVFPWMFEDYGELVAHARLLMRWLSMILARLYDAAPSRVISSPGGAIYEHDMYGTTLLAETASRVNGMKTWLTDEYDHNGLRVAELILKQLQSLVQLNGDL